VHQELGEVALSIAESVLAPGGSFLAKVSRGGEEKQFRDRLAALFKVSNVLLLCGSAFKARTRSDA
jgi:23S rRNA U2552 (ribose-2'-O)-methylase RlmE/FtsJ